MTTTIYSTTVTATGGRGGRAESADGNLSLDMTIPKEMGGPGGEGTNPEQLFAAGYAACFETALRVVGRERKIATDDASISATVGLVKEGESGFVLEVTLAVSLPDVPQDVARDLATTVHESVCPYSKAIRGNVDVTIEIV